MKRFACLLLFGLVTDLAVAQARMSTVDRPCSASRQDVFRNGAIVLGTGGQTYDRFVRDRSFCEINEITEPAWAPSADMQACFIGYRCKDSDAFRD